MNAPGAQQTLFKELVADLPDQQKGEFFRNLHEAGISPNDVELARLLRALQLYKSYYETIPASVQKAVAEIERLNLTIAEVLNSSDGVSSRGRDIGPLLCRLMVRARLRRFQQSIYDQLDPIRQLLLAHTADGESSVTGENPGAA